MTGTYLTLLNTHVMIVIITNTDIRILIDLMTMFLVLGFARLRFVGGERKGKIELCDERIGLIDSTDDIS